MKFELYSYYKRRTWERYERLYMVASMIGLLVSVPLIYFKEEIDSVWIEFAFYFIFGAWIVAGFARFMRLSSVYDAEKTRSGTLGIGEDFIDWNGQQVAWTNIAEIVIQYHKVKGHNSFEWTGLAHTISDGMNLIRLGLLDGTKLEGWYTIGSEYEHISLQDLLRRAVLKHTLPYSVAVAVLKPKNYKAHQELKEALA